MAVIIDLHARQNLGWYMKPTIAREIVIDALISPGVSALWLNVPQFEARTILSFCRKSSRAIRCVILGLPQELQYFWCAVIHTMRI
jgi:hypothetical protein